jgi:hypothetical protein
MGLFIGVVVCFISGILGFIFMLICINTNNWTEISWSRVPVAVKKKTIRGRDSIINYRGKEYKVTWTYARVRMAVDMQAPTLYGNRWNAKVRVR